MLARNLMFYCLAGVAFGALGGCSVEQTEQGKMPEVSVEGGNLPEYEVETPDIDVGTETRQVKVPTVDVDLPNDDEVDDSEIERKDAYSNR